MQQIELFQQALWAYVMHICAFLQFCLIFIKAFISLLATNKFHRIRNGRKSYIKMGLG